MTGSDKQSTLETTIAVIADHTSRLPEDLSESTTLFRDGLDLDSIELLEVLLEIESRIGIELRGTDFEADAFHTIATLASHVDGQRP